MTMNALEILRNHPEVVLLDRLDKKELAAYLRNRGLLETGESITGREKPGEGNMNFTLRVKASGGSFILKQSRPWVEKYPQILAPWDRAIREARFFELVSKHPDISGGMPRLLDLDPVSRILAIEDLGESSDFTHLYNPENQFSEEDLSALCQWLSALHQIKFDRQSQSSLVNRDMRQLNHEHIFDFPLNKDNGLDLDAITPGLKEEAAKLIEDRKFVLAVRKIGELYLKDGKTLLHGDYFPGSWLNTANGVRVIDPEFGFFGPAEFDAGVMLGHLFLSEQQSSVISSFSRFYRPPDGFDSQLMQAFAGVEIMRRLIGVAQLPLPYGLEKKASLLAKAKSLVLG